MASSSDKRKTDRVRLNVEVTYSFADMALRDPIPAKARDISPTGMLLVIQEPAETGSVINLQFKLPKSGIEDGIEVEAEVMRVAEVRGKQVALGIRFRRLKALHYEVIEDFINRMLGVSTGDSVKTDSVAEKSGGYSYSVDKYAQISDEKFSKNVDKMLRAQKREAVTGQASLIVKYLIRLGIIGVIILILYFSWNFFTALIKDLLEFKW